MLKVENLSRPWLGPVNMALPEGAIGVIMGASGSGKTLLARAISDLDPNNGEVLWKGRARSRMPAPQWRRLIGYVPAESGWWAERVGDHFLPDDGGICPLLAEAGLPEDAPGWPVSRLSTGEKQRLALVRAVQRRPEVLILDEPTSALDEASRQRIEALLLRLNEGGMTFLLITHDPQQARRLGSHFWRIDKGAVQPLEGAP